MGNGLAHCFSGGGSRRFEVAAVTWEPCDEGVGHSFRYVRPDSEVSSSFRCISGAAVSANVSTALSTSLLLDVPGPPSAASAFESSTSFSSVALQTATEQGFMSGPLERGFKSAPIDRRARLFSGPIETPSSLSAQLRRSRRASAQSLFRGLGRAMTLAVSAAAANGRGAIVAPIKGRKDSNLTDVEAAQWPDSPDSLNGNLHWAQGKAGEDRVHVVVSEEHGWLFVGIYDGFNGPDATDFLLSNLYAAVHRELKGLLSEDKDDTSPSPAAMDEHRRKPRVATKNRDANHGRRRSDFKRKTTEANHSRVLKALYRALRSTEDCFLDIADKMVSENPELALMGSCVLVMLMKGDDVYLMNVGDSRAILARNAEEPDLWSIDEETLFELEAQNDANPSLDELPSLSALQLTFDHSTSVEEELRRIRNAHPDDTSSVSNDRVKGSLRVTRAFGAGFLKQPKWNNALLEMFRIDYVGTSPYITCNPSLHHHKLGPRDRFLILSSDGLYQYFTNQDAVAQVEMFMATTPEGDPAQHLAEEVLLRAATRAGMDIHELLEIPRGDRRRYHDDISIIVISLEGGLWRSCL